MPQTSNLDLARRYLKAIEAGDAAYVLSLFSPDAVFEQLPNRVYPQGSRANASQAQEAFEKGRKIFSRQTYEITNEAVTGDIVAGCPILCCTFANGGLLQAQTESPLRRVAPGSSLHLEF